MRRKVIKQGHNTLTLTLPARWVEEKRIKPGDELDIDDKGDVLCVSAPGTTDRSMKISLDLRDVDMGLLKRYIHTIYKLGYDEIQIIYNNPALIQNLQDILQRNLIGYEIINQTKTSCEIRSLSMLIDSEFDNSLNRTFLLLFSLAEETLDAIKANDIDHLKSAALLEETNNRLTTYCRRIINKNGSKGGKITSLYYVVEQLEKLADSFKFLASHIVESGVSMKKVSPEVLAVYSDVIVYMRMYYSLYYMDTKDESKMRQKINEIYLMRKSLQKRQYKLIQTEHSINAIIIHHLTDVTQVVWDIVAHYMAMRF